MPPRNRLLLRQIWQLDRELTIRKRQQAAIVVQGWWRVMYQKHYLPRRNAACVIQKWWRYCRIRRIGPRKFAAALVIWKWWLVQRERLECYICTEIDGAKQLPTCGHLICYCCMKAIVRKKRLPIFECPMCRYVQPIYITFTPPWKRAHVSKNE